MHLTNWDAIPPSHPQPGVTTRRFDSDGMTIVRYEFAPGAAFPVHSHPEEQVVILLKGQVAFTIGNQEVMLGPGAVCHVPPHVPHGAVAGPEPVVFLNLLSPRRVGESVTYHTP